MFPGSINKKNNLEKTFAENDVYETDTDFSVIDCDTESDEEERERVPENFNDYIFDENDEKITEETEVTNKNPFSIYDIDNLLDPDLNNIQKIGRFTNISVCIYNTCNNSTIPFLQYYLEKSLLFDILDFPSLCLDYFSDIYNELDLFIRNIVVIKEKYIIKGFRVFEERNYIFIDLGNNEINVDNSLTFLAIIDEITNKRKIYDMIICYKVTNLFIENPELIFLKNEINKNYEIPIVAYQSVEERRLNFTFMFGITKSDNKAIMGPYFYFSNYENVLEKVSKKEGKYGIIRCCLFLGTMKIPMNFLEDETDESLLKRELIQQNNKQAALTLRISDHDGNWSNLYDSVYLGRTILDDGSFLKDTPQWVIKNHCQQYSLSYKIISKKIKIN